MEQHLLPFISMFTRKEIAAIKADGRNRNEVGGDLMAWKISGAEPGNLRIIVLNFAQPDDTRDKDGVDVEFSVCGHITKRPVTKYGMSEEDNEQDARRLLSIYPRAVLC